MEGFTAFDDFYLLEFPDGEIQILGDYDLIAGEYDIDIDAMSADFEKYSSTDLDKKYTDSINRNSNLSSIGWLSLLVGLVVIHFVSKNRRTVLIGWVAYLSVITLTFVVGSQISGRPYYPFLPVITIGIIYALIFIAHFKDRIVGGDKEVDFP